MEMVQEVGCVGGAVLLKGVMSSCNRRISEIRARLLELGDEGVLRDPADKGAVTSGDRLSGSSSASQAQANSRV